MALQHEQVLPSFLTNPIRLILQLRIVEQNMLRTSACCAGHCGGTAEGGPGRTAGGGAHAGGGPQAGRASAGRLPGGMPLPAGEPHGFPQYRT